MQFESNSRILLSLSRDCDKQNSLYDDKIQVLVFERIIGIYHNYESSRNVIRIVLIMNTRGLEMV